MKGETERDFCDGGVNAWLTHPLSSLAWEKECFLRPPPPFRCGFPQAEEEKNAKLKTAQQFPVVELRHIFMPMQQSGGFVT